jgi:hypothetical protein
LLLKLESDVGLFAGEEVDDEDYQVNQNQN